MHELLLRHFYLQFREGKSDILSRSGGMGEERAAQSAPCHIAKRMHRTALENLKGGRRTLTSS